MLRSRVPQRALLASVAMAIHDPPKEKLSIYASPNSEILLLETPSKLERQIGVVRRSVTKTYNDSYAQVQGLVSKWIGIEHAIENRVKSIISPTEPLTPGILYVGIATLTGSILARNRFLPTRLILPPTLLLLSLNHFLPQTSHNLSTYVTSLEEEHLPTVAQKHRIANAHTRMTWERLKESTQTGREMVGQQLEGLVGKVQGVTGLKLKEGFRWGEGIVKETEGKGLELSESHAGAVKDKVGNPMEVGAVGVDQKVDEFKKLV